MRYIIDHLDFHITWTSVAAAVIFVAILVLVIYKLKKFKKAQDELNDQLSGRDAGVAAERKGGSKSLDQNAPNIPEEGAYGS